MESSTHPDRKANLQNQSRVSKDSSEMKAIRKEIFGHQGLKTYPIEQPMAIRESSEVNAKDRGENMQNGAGARSVATFEKAKLSGPETLAQLRERHDALALYIKKMKEEIANHPTTIEREEARKTQEESMKFKKEKSSDDDMDIDIILD